jgi:leucyl aminopeptidase (aminopeptidase T)
MRFASTTSLGAIETKDFRFLIKTINLNYPKIQKNHKAVKSVIEKGTELHVRTNAGTDLHMKIDYRKIHSADGDYTKPGSGGNIPAGEVYFPPKKESVNGRVVIDGSSRNRYGTIIIKNPLTLIIKNSNLIKIEGDKEAKLLEETLSWAERNSKYPGGIRKVCEFGIGLNPKAKIIGSTIVDEKTLGTAHIALGSNNWFGGSIFAMTHLDQVFKNPRITVNGRLLNI